MSTTASPSPSVSEFIDQSEAAKILGLSQASITKLIARGLLPSYEAPYVGRGRRTGGTGAPLRKTRRDDVLAFDARFPVRERHRSYKVPQPAPPRSWARIFIPGGFIHLVGAAKLCGVHTNTLRKWVANGTLATEEVVGRHGKSTQRLRRSTLDAFIAAGMPRPPMGRPKGSPNRPK
jgi:excisionase family DNA binding protein